MKVKLVGQNYCFKDIKCGTVFILPRESSPVLMKCYTGIGPKLSSFAVHLETGELINFSDTTIIHPIEGVFTQENSNEG